MSISDKLTRLSAAHDAIAAAITQKGGTVNTGDGFEDFAVDIATIPGSATSEPIYGVSGLYASSPALTRTDDAVGMDFLINSSTGAVDSDFDDVFPWNEAEVVTLDAGKFLRLPKMYFRVGVDNSHRITDIAVSKSAGSSGDWYAVESFDVACYGAYIDGTALKSVTGVSRGANETRATFRTYAANTGTGYFQYDFYHRTVLQFLWLIEFATKDSASIMTGRVAESGMYGDDTVRLTGGTDAVPTQSGFERPYGQMRWHYIEDFVGNLCEFIDGIIMAASGSPSYVTTDPTKFSDSDNSNMSVMSFNNANVGCIAALGWDPDNPFFAVPIETVSNSRYNTYFYDSFGAYSASPVMYCGTFHSSRNNEGGLFRITATITSNRSTNCGTRLLHTPQQS